MGSKGQTNTMSASNSSPFFHSWGSHKKECKNVQNGRCYHHNCMFAHNKEQQELAIKIDPCYHYMTTGSCHRYKCTKAHPVAGDAQIVCDLLKLDPKQNVTRMEKWLEKKGIENVGSLRTLKDVVAEIFPAKRTASGNVRVLKQNDHVTKAVHIFKEGNWGALRNATDCGEGVLIESLPEAKAEIVIKNSYDYAKAKQALQDALDSVHENERFISEQKEKLTYLEQQREYLRCNVQLRESETNLKI